ncbi:MAG: DUF932 domain-containing protein [Candidatus Nitrosocaldus sp.]
MERRTEATATILVKDIKYPFEQYQVGIGIPYLKTEVGEKKLKRRVVIRNINGLYNGLEVVAIVGNNFALIPNEIVAEMTDKTIDAYGLKQLHKHTDKKGYALRIDLVSDITGEVRKGDIVQFGVSVRNSIDGTSSLGADFFSYRLICKNGAVARDTELTYSIRHIGDPKELLSVFHKSLGRVLERADAYLTLYKKMSEVEMTKEHARKLLSLGLPPIYYEKAGIVSNDDKIEISEGTTLWEAFNGITYVTTHISRASPLQKSSITSRVHRVMQNMV